ncbi:unnamed protein product, partial [Symbiodinium sp. CCMP2456]
MAPAFRPCSRARCRHCGMNVGALGVKGFGWSLRLHETRCAATSAVPSIEATTTGPSAAPTVEATTTEPMMAAGLLQAAQLLASHVDVATDVTVLRRPGSGDEGPLTLALGQGPGEPGEIVVKARPARLLPRAPCQQAAMSLDILSNELPLSEHMNTDSVVNFHENFRDIAVRHCVKLQQLTQRLAANLTSGRGPAVVVKL